MELKPRATQMTAQSLKTGTLIETHGTPAIGGFPAVAPVRARIARWTKSQGDIPNHVSATNGGWHHVRYDDGGALLIHETGFRVIDNRA
jgi:hypothetical protein